MKPRHYIIYIPGLGDSFDPIRIFALRLWRIYGVKVQHVPMLWFKRGDYEQKLSQIQSIVLAAQKEGYLVSLIGESAGASMALNAAASIDGLHRVITVAGVNSSSMPIALITQRRAPAFKVSADNISHSLRQIKDKLHIHTVRALIDNVVSSSRYNDIRGAHNHTILTVGHRTTVIFCLFILSWYIIRLIKKS